MRHLGRVHKIAVAWLHERWLAGDFILFYEKSELMAADIYTKAFTDKNKWKAVCWLINVVGPVALRDAIHYNGEMKARIDAEAAEKSANKEAAPAPEPPGKPAEVKPTEASSGNRAAVRGRPVEAKPTEAGSSNRAAVRGRELSSASKSAQTAAPNAEEATAMPEVAPSDDMEWRGVTELCTSTDSALGRKTRFQKGCRVTRIT